MSHSPNELQYTATHEWVRKNEDGTITVGVTDHAQQLLGDLVFVELPELQESFEKGVEICVLESVKAAADAYAPMSGTVVEVNEVLNDTPEVINEDPYGAGWIFKLEPSDESQADDLLSAEAYQAQVAQEQH